MQGILRAPPSTTPALWRVSAQVRSAASWRSGSRGLLRNRQFVSRSHRGLQIEQTDPSIEVRDPAAPVCAFQPDYGLFDALNLALEFAAFHDPRRRDAG